MKIYCLGIKREIDKRDCYNAPANLDCQLCPYKASTKQQSGLPPESMLLIDFCNVRQWDLKTISELMEKYQIQQNYDGPKDIIINCKTRHDKQHFYVLIENDQAKILQQHIPESFILPSQPEFQQLWKYLRKSQDEYKGFLDSCIKGNLDLSYLNRLIAEIKTPEPMFFPVLPVKPKKRKKELVKWNPVLRLLDHGDCIEDAINLEIIHVFLSQRGQVFSNIKCCEHKICYNYFIFKRRTRDFCSDKCRYDYYMKKTKHSKDYPSS